MKQKTSAIQDSYDAVKFLEAIKESQDYKTATAVLVNIFTERTQEEYIAYISSMVRTKLEKAKISGLTCLRGFAQGERVKRATILTVFFFFSSDIEILEYDFDSLSIQSAKDDFLKKLTQCSDLKGIQVFTTTLKNNVTNEFLSSISSELAEIPVFGAGAGYPVGSETSDLFVFGENIHENGIVITLFRGKNLRIYAETTLGWTPIGKEMKVTGVLNNRILKTLDDVIAGDVYKNYLGVSSPEYFVENTCEFPFMLKRNGKWIARVPVHKDEDGYIHFTSDIHKGEKLVFSYGAKKLILQKAFNLAEYMSRKNLEGLLLHICRNRVMYLKDDENLELEAFSNFYRETAGCYAFAEILYKNNSGGLQNSALVAIGFREASETDGNMYAEDCYVEDFFYGNDKFVDFTKVGEDIILNKKNKPLPFEERLVNFLHATSRDLYQANQKLEEAATIDALTKIFNRKKISERISYELKKRDTASHTNLIMFDIDNFKHVNDTYGHDMGDEVLVRVAQTAKQCIREQDSIGRWGGEEFMILLPGSAKDDAVAIAERIRSAVNSLDWEQMNHISISLGVTTVRENDDIQTAYKRVDSRLYYAKTHGKNCVVSEDLDE
ncbi:MAG: GGDEF domain-containing protein [Treponema sp.]|nr:GGDEF domain-containing protein [Treponema sp.]